MSIAIRISDNMRYSDRFAEWVQQQPIKNLEFEQLTGRRKRDLKKRKNITLNTLQQIENGLGESFLEYLKNND